MTEEKLPPVLDPNESPAAVSKREELLHILRGSEDHWERRAAAFKLENYRDEEVTRAFIEAVKDTSSHVRYAATLMLYDRPSEEVRKALVEVAGNDSEDRWVKNNAEKALKHPLYK